MNKKRDSGLGMEAFFPPTAEEASHEITSSTIKEADVTAPTRTLDERKVQQSSKRKTANVTSPGRTLRARVAASAESHDDKEDKTQRVKLTIMVEQDKLDRLEELKLAERRRLRELGERNWRVTITRFVEEALEDFLTRKR